MTVAVAPEQAWDGLMFYEEIVERPTLALRLLLPFPVGIEGNHENVGDEAKCLYVRGHLRKRVVRIDRGRLCEFDVTEQNLSIGRGLKLLGGAYRFRGLPGGCTEVAIETRYLSHRQPRWLWKPIESAVCHLFHRHLLGVVRRRVELR
jgi:hypothetical protein